MTAYATEIDWNAPSKPAPIGKPWACPDARRVLPYTAPRADWLAARETGIGGSDIAALMGDNPYPDGTRWHVWASKVGLYDPEQSPAMRRGVAMEHIVVGEFLRQAPELRTRKAGLLQSKKYSRLLVSVDRLTSDGGGLECKTTTSRSIEGWPKDESCPPLYEWQAHQAMAVTGRPHWWVAALVVDDWTLSVWKIERNESLNALLAGVCTGFYVAYVQPNHAPPVDKNLITDQEIKDRWPVDDGGDITLTEQDAEQLRQWITERAEFKTQARELTELTQDIDQRLRILAGDNRTVRWPSGRVAYTWGTVNRTAFDAERFAHDHPGVDLDNYRRPAPSRSLSVKKELY